MVDKQKASRNVKIKNMTFTEAKELSGFELNTITTKTPNTNNVKANALK